MSRTIRSVRERRRDRRITLRKPVLATLNAAPVFVLDISGGGVRVALDDREVNTASMVATTPSGDREVQMLTLGGLASRLADRLIHIFIRDADGYRPVYGPRGTRKAELFAHDPHWQDLLLFHEYFHGDTGEGLGASHQTGWTALVASLIDEWRS